MKDLSQVRTLDVSGLEPCEPLEKTIKALEQLPEEHCLQVLLRREPHPLFPMLEKRGFSWKMLTGPSSAIELWIWHQGSQHAADLVPSQNLER